MESVHSTLAECEAVIKQLRTKLLKVQQLVIAEADKGRLQLEFAVGDWVYVKLRPYRQLSLFVTTVPKLAKHYFGPFQAMERIGAIAYKLNLPVNARIHPVFYSSLLKKHYGEPPASVSRS